MNKKLLLISIPFIVILGVLMHFAYDNLGQSIVIGILAPVNESVWEHLKLLFFPSLLWWLIAYLIWGEKNSTSIKKWLITASMSTIAGILIILILYYTYTGAFGIESLILDILIFILAVIISQIVAVWVYKNSCPNNLCFYLNLIILIIVTILFIIFTFNPPQIPLFYDPLTGNYGI